MVPSGNDFAGIRALTIICILNFIENLHNKFNHSYQVLQIINNVKLINCSQKA